MRGVVCAIVAGVALAAAGCGSSVKGEGKVVKGGAPYQLAEGEGITISLLSDDNQHAATGSVEKDGTFKLAGASGGAVTPAKYKVTVTHYHPAKGKGGSAPETRNLDEVWDLTSSKTDLTVDINQVHKK